MKKTLKLFSRYQARDLLIERLKKNPEFFLKPTSSIDKGVIYNIFLEEGEKLGLPYAEQTMNNATIDSPYIRAQYDLEMGIPVRIALIGWLIVESFPDAILQRIFNYVFYKPEEEKQKFYELQLKYVLRGLVNQKTISEVFQDANLDRFIADELQRSCT